MRRLGELVERCRFAWMALEMQLNARRELGGCDQGTYANADLEQLALKAQERARQLTD